MPICVELPSDELVELNSLCRAIAKAMCPAGEIVPEGIDCIVGKRVTCQAMILESPVGISALDATYPDSTSDSHDGAPTDEAPHSDQSRNSGGNESEPPDQAPPALSLVEHAFPYDLTDKDRAELAELLPSLPPLRYPISKEQQEAFEQAYSQLTNRPAWLPILMSENTMAQRKAEQERVRGLHQKALLQEVSEGRITLLDAYHARVAGPGAVAFLSRTQAIGYLERYGLSVATGAQDSTCDSGPTSPNAPQAIDPPEPTPSDELPMVGKSKHSAEDIQKAVEKWHKHTADRIIKSPTKAIALEYQVTDRTVRKWLEKARDKKAREDARQKNITAHKLQ